ncbi:hypothetical protein KO465_10575 [Candidatus Micrarchaeota archaeon]|jgi:cobalamin synthase|nr:hypothetical protein [Candidatus Micrarchaeota archaeon]
MKKSESIKNTDIAKHLSDVLAESRTLTGLIGIIFGFLLNVIFSGSVQNLIELWLLETAIICSVLSLALFAMPVIYHHLQFPYSDKNKYILRSHWFISVGFIPAIVMFYTSVTLALYKVFSVYAFLVSAFLFILIYIIYQNRYRVIKINRYRVIKIKR